MLGPASFRSLRRIPKLRNWDVCELPLSRLSGPTARKFCLHTASEEGGHDEEGVSGSQVFLNVGLLLHR
jgi:hypothetical protein